MCQRKNTDACSGNCNSCSAPTVHATNLQMRVQQLSNIADTEHAVLGLPPFALNQHIEKDIL